MLEFFIPIEPVPQGRPRFRVFQAKGGGKPRVTTYDPKESKDFKEAIIRHLKKLKLIPYDKDIPVMLRLRFFLSKPKSVKRQHPTVKPDLDNLTKGVKDALKGFAWYDDSQVCASGQSKKYAPEGQQAGVWVQVNEIKD